MSAWWREAVLYEVYIRSFADSNGDGVGDLEGIRSRLDYLHDLDVDGIWITPFYPSPGVDHGYDVSEYRDVDPLFGTLADFDRLLGDAHARGLRVIVDVVPNHTSIEHPWFREHPEYYVWADTPNNWLSVFGGPAWTWDSERGKYYLHLFAPEQPDLDWHNPDVRREFEEILRFWLDRGVDGFRIDVAHGLFKPASLPDDAEPNPALDSLTFDLRVAIDQPELHPLYREWHELAASYEGERLLLGEVYLLDPFRVADYVRPDELHLAFNFTLLRRDWSEPELRSAIAQTIDAFAPVAATPTWVLENHDIERLPTRYGRGADGESRARAAALLLLALPGAAFIYQGQELGLEEVDLPDSLRQDPVFFRSEGRRKGRDGCRIPMPWDEAPPSFGFTSGMPWLPMPRDWGAVSVAAQKGVGGSTLALFRDAIALRRAHEALRGGSFAWRDSPSGTLVFERSAAGVTIVCAVNVSAPELHLPAGEVLLRSAAPSDGFLRPGTAAWVRS